MWEQWGVEFLAFPLTWHIACCYRTSLDIIWKPTCDFLLVISSNLGSILHHSVTDNMSVTDDDGPTIHRAASKSVYWKFYEEFRKALWNHRNELIGHWIWFCVTVLLVVYLVGLVIGLHDSIVSSSSYIALTALGIRQELNKLRLTFFYSTFINIFCDVS